MFYKILKSKYSAFTIVELLVTITILMILWTVSLLWYSSYISWVRDTNRLSQLDNISKALNVYRWNKKLPDVTNWVNIYWTWWILLSQQWYAWEEVLKKIWYTDWWQDPLDKKYFTYYITANKKYFQWSAPIKVE
jgi:type II secretory pathway pseudopilin PulG